MARDPRQSVYYQRMLDTIDLIQKNGPMTMTEICDHFGISVQQWKNLRYGMPGRLALEDEGLTMPRPVCGEEYVYKLSSTYKTGAAAVNGEPNFLNAISDLLTRQATVYADIERLTEMAAVRSKIRKLLGKLKRDVGGTLDRMEDVVDEAKAPISEWAQHVLDKIA